MRTYRIVVEVEVEDQGINESYPTVGNVQRYVNDTLADNMGHQRDNGLPIKVKGLRVGKAERTK